MITHLCGKLLEKKPTGITIDVAGVGYEVSIPLSTYSKLGDAGEQVQILTILHVREDAHLLYGFATPEERDLFKRLISVPGVGPRTAIAVLSGSSVVQLKEAIASGDVDVLKRIPGIGQKTAERMIVDLKDKLQEEIGAGEMRMRAGVVPVEDAIKALVSLGYRRAAASEMVRKVVASEKPESLEAIIRRALRLL